MPSFSLFTEGALRGPWRSGVVFGLLGQEVVRQVKGHVNVHRLVIKVVLEGLLARRKGRADALALVLARGSAELCLQLGLERPAGVRRGREQGQERGEGVTAHRFASIIISARASPHDENSAGCSVTLAFEKSRTLICESTWALTSGKMLSYKLEEILTKPSGIMEISPIWSLSAFSEMADTMGWSADTRTKRRWATCEEKATAESGALSTADS